MKFWHWHRTANVTYRAAATLALLAAFMLLTRIAQGGGVRAPAGEGAAFRVRAYLPLTSASERCPTSSNRSYQSISVLQYDLDNPVRPAALHADKNIALRGYVKNNDSSVRKGLVDYGSDDPVRPPQFATLFATPRVPRLTNLYQVRTWKWAPSPDPGTPGPPDTSPPVTALGLGTSPGEELRAPTSDYDIGGGMEVVVLFADEDTVTLHYTREDTAALGYTVHVDGICTDRNLLSLYRTLDRANGPRYVYKSPSSRPYAYNLPTLPAGKAFGTARQREIVVAIVDSGKFMDPRSCREWWQIRPGYGSSCG